MATVALGPLYVGGTISGNAPQVVSMPEAASQTYLAGAVVVINAAGHIAVGASDATNILGVACGPGKNDSSAGNSTNEFYVANGDTIFIGNLSGAASALTDVGLAYGIVKTGNNFHVDKTDTTNRRCIILKLDSRDDVGDTNHRVHFVFHPLHRRLAYTS